MADRIYGCEQIRSNPSLPPPCDLAGSTGWAGAGASYGAWPVSVQA